MENVFIKKDVLNPIDYFNTVGKEIIDIIQEDNILLEKLEELGFNNIHNQEKFSKSNLKKITDLVEKPELLNYLFSFQIDYKENKLKSDLEFKKLKRIFTKIKHIDILLNNEFNEGVDKLEDLLHFLEIENEEDIFTQVEKNIALYRISHFEPNSLNLYSWLKRGELELRKAKIKSYDKNLLLNWLNNSNWKENINDPDYFLNIPSIFREFGVCVVLTPYLEKTVFGCVRWFDNIPLIQISDKGKCLATCWYTLLHEIGHVIKHENDEIFEGNIDLPKNKISQKEREANEFAFKYLFNGDSVRKYIFKFSKGNVSIDFIENTSTQFNVPTNFVAYWTKKAQIRGVNYNRYLTQIHF